MTRISATVWLESRMTPERAQTWCEEHTVYDLLDRGAECDGPSVEDQEPRAKPITDVHIVSYDGAYPRPYAAVFSNYALASQFAEMRTGQIITTQIDAQVDLIVPPLNDREIVSQIQELLDLQEWNADTLDAIGQIMAKGGYKLRQPAKS